MNFEKPEENLPEEKQTKPAGRLMNKKELGDFMLGSAAVDRVKAKPEDMEAVEAEELKPNEKDETEEVA